MDAYILKLKYTQLCLPVSQKPESRDFPRAKLRTITPKCRSSLLDLKSHARPETPKPSGVYNYSSLLMMKTRISPSIPKTPGPQRRQSSKTTSKSSTSKAGEYAKQHFRVKSPKKVQTIPLSSLKLLS
jgi:hypothetical protein